MVESVGLTTIVLTLLLVVLTTSGDFAAPSGSDKRSSWQAPLFILAIQVIGFAIAGAALYEAASPLTRHRRLSTAELRVESRFIIALMLLIAIMAVYKVLAKYINSSQITPWDRGALDRATPMSGLAMAIPIVALIGVSLDEILISTSRIKSVTATFVIGGLLVLGVGIAWTLLRRLGGDPSPLVFAMSRRQQQRWLSALDGAKGAWVSIELRAATELEPPLAMSATVWKTRQNWDWRTDDAYRIPRYHEWAANHALRPTRALHSQRVTVFAGPRPHSMRGLRITPTTRRRWLIDAWKSHRDQPPLPVETSSQEYKAGLVRISPEQLREAGLLVTLRQR